MHEREYHDEHSQNGRSHTQRHFVRQAAQQIIHISKGDKRQRHHVAATNEKADMAQQPHEISQVSATPWLPNQKQQQCARDEVADNAGGADHAPLKIGQQAVVKFDIETRQLQLVYSKGNPSQSVTTLVHKGRDEIGQDANGRNRQYVNPPARLPRIPGRR
jgi:hypothetical protein